MTRIRFRAAVVRAVEAEGPGWQRLAVDVLEPAPAGGAEPAAPASAEAAQAPPRAGLQPRPGVAWHDTALFGRLAPGDRVILNTTAAWLGLGTGGVHFVYWVPGAEHAPDPQAPGHVMKLRYSPGQIRVLAAEEEAGAALALEPGAEPAGLLGGMPVVVGTLHSQLAAAVAGIASAWPRARIAYVMTDGGALPASFSRLAAELRRLGLVVATITCGHAYGGDVEAVSPASALAAARRALRADVAVAVMGPGVVGTGTALGTTALEAAALIDTVAALGGTPVFAVRAGSSDRRPRHRGISHHALSVLRLARSAALVALPRGGAGGRLHAQLRDAGLAVRHVICYTEAAPGLRHLRRLGIEVTTMGRGPSEERLLFAAASAAGRLAGLLARRLRGGDGT